MTKKQYMSFATVLCLIREKIYAPPQKKKNKKKTENIVILP